MYGNFVLNKVWFIASAILAAVGAVVTAVLHGALPESGLDGSALLISELVVLATCNEWLGRNLESNLKTRFADYALAGGITKAQFVTAEMLKNLISTGISFLMCVVMQLVLCVVDRGFLSVNNLTALLAAALFVGTTEWTCVPVIVSLKSAEKAGLLVGLVLGFCVILPMFTVLRAFLVEADEDFFPKLLELVGKPWLVLVWAVVCAAVYVLFYFIMLNRVKKGDVC